MLGEKLFCDRYVLEEKLGSGTLGDIYRATDTRSNRPVAVRLVTEVQDPLALATYYRQWAIQAGIRHENVGVILDIGEATEDEERYPVVVTPLIEGTALRDLFVQPLRNSDPKDWLAAITKAAWGLQVAHERGLIHGRLHSGNILLDRDGGVRVVDFGSAGSAKRTDGVRRDLAGLGAICFETLTSAEAPTERSDGEAALATTPATTSEISGVIVDTLWPETEGHFSSAKDFAIALADALRSVGGESEESKIAPVDPMQGPSVEGGASREPVSQPTIALDPVSTDERIATSLKGLDERLSQEESVTASDDPIATIEERAARLPDLGEAIRLLETEASTHPDSPRLKRLIALYRDKLDVVSEVLARIEQLEAAGKFDEATEQREILRSIHPGNRPDIPSVGSTPDPPPKPTASETPVTEAVELPDLSSQPTIFHEKEPLNSIKQPTPTDTASVDDDEELEKRELFWVAARRNQTDQAGVEPRQATASVPEKVDGPEVRAAADSTEADNPAKQPGKLDESFHKAAEALAPRVASLSASMKSQLQQLSSPDESQKEEKEKTEPEEPKQAEKAAPPRLKWMYIVGAAIVVILLLALVLIFGGSAAVPVAAVRQTEIRAYPAQAEIRLDGELCGSGECAVELEIGSHRATARLAGFESDFEIFNVEAPREGVAVEDTPPQRVELYLTALFPSLDIETDLARGNVFLDDIEVGEIEDGAFSLRELADGEHALRIRSGAVETTVVVETKAGSAPIITSVESREAKVLVASSLATTATVWSSTPTVGIAVDGQEHGPSGPEGLKIAGLAEGPHRLGADGSGAIASFRADNRPRLVLAVNTDRNVGGLRIVTGQDGATVYLNDRPYRRKTARGSLLVFLYPGTYRVRVEKPGFVSTPEYSVKITKGAREAITDDLVAQPRLATLSLRGAPPGAEVRIDGERIGEVSSDGSFSYEAVTAGDRVIQIGKSGYRNRTVKQQFEIGQETSIDGSLVRSTGDITVSVEPADVDAHLVVRDSAGSIIRLENRRASALPEGGYRIEASANGFRSITSEVRVIGGENVVAEIQLESLAAPRPTVPQNLAAVFANDPAWSRRGDQLIRRGGGIVLVPAMGVGKYRFAVNLLRGRRLQWVVNYVDSENYGWFQMGRNNFIRSIVLQGQRSRPYQEPHALAEFRAVTIEVEVKDEEIVHRLLRNGEWIELDRWKFTGADFAKGQFGFRLPGRDEIAVHSLDFTAAR